MFFFPANSSVLSVACLSAFVGSWTEMSSHEKGEPRPIPAPLLLAESQVEGGTQNGAEGWVCEVGVAWQGVEGRD